VQIAQWPKCHPQQPALIRPCVSLTIEQQIVLLWLFARSDRMADEMAQALGSNSTLMLLVALAAGLLVIGELIARGRIEQPAPAVSSACSRLNSLGRS
jgi:hypothetical protein